MLKALMPAAVYACSCAWVRARDARAPLPCQPQPARRAVPCRACVRGRCGCAAHTKSAQGRTHARKREKCARGSLLFFFAQGVETRKTETIYIMMVLSMGVVIASYGAQRPLSRIAHSFASSSLTSTYQASWRSC